MITHEDIEQRLKELDEQPDFIVHDVRAALSDLPDMSMRFLDSMNEHLLVASGGRRRSHWERHLGSDEMIYVMDGETEIVTLTDDGPVEVYHSCGVVVCLPGRIVASPDAASVRVGVLPDSESHREAGSATQGAGAQAQGSRDWIPRSSGSTICAPRCARCRISRSPTRPTGEDADAAMRNVAKIGNLTLGVMSYTGQTPWERHPDGDELLLVLDGELEVTTLTDDGPVTRKLRAGEAFVCPQGLWHRQFAEKSVSMLYGTPTETSEISMADDPRVASVRAAPAPRSITPFLYIEGVASAVEFYKSVFGATVLMRDEEPSGIVSHAMLKMGETTVMLSDPTSAHIKEKEVQALSRPPRSYGGSPVHLYIYVADADDVVRRAVAAGAKIVDPVEDKEWGDRCGGIEDPYGHVWFVGTPLKDLRSKDSKK